MRLEEAPVVSCKDQPHLRVCRLLAADLFFLSGQDQLTVLKHKVGSLHNMQYRFMMSSRLTR